MAEAPVSEATTNAVDGQSLRLGASDQLIDPWCEPCLEDTRMKINAISYCPMCNVCFCRSCDESHRKMPISRIHRVVRGSRMPKSYADKPVMYPDCSVHAGNKTDHYCQDHHKMICSDCVKHDHQNCRAIIIAKVCKDLGSEDIKQFKALVDSMKDNLNTTKTELEMNVSQLESKKKMLITQAEEEQDKVIDRARQLFEETVKIINESCSKNKSLVNEQIFKLDDEIHSLSAIAQYVEKKICVADKLDTFDQNMFIQMQELVGNAQDAKRELDNLTRQLYRVELTFIPTKAISVCFNENKTLGDIKEALTPSGPVKDERHIYFPLHPSTILKSVSCKTPIDITQLSVKKLSSFSASVPAYKGKYYIAGMAVTDDGKLLVSYIKGRSVKVFTLDGKFLSLVTFNTWCYGITLITARTAVVSTWDYKLHFLDLSEPSSISVQRSISLGYWVCSITTSNDKLIFIPCGQKSVKKIDMAGQEVWSISKGPDDQMLFQKPYSLMIHKMNGKDIVVVSDWGKQSIFLLDVANGALLKTIDMTGKNCHGLTVDRHGNIFVCCNTIREIRVWSNDFTKSRVVLADPNIRPHPVLIEYNWDTCEIFVAYYKNDEIDRFQVSLAEK